MRLISDARAAFRAAPLEVALTLAAAVLFSLGIHADRETAWIGRALAAIALALPAVFALTLLHVHGSLAAVWRWSLSAAAVALATLYAFLGFDPDLEGTAWRLALLFGASVLLPFVAPAAARPRDPDWAWRVHGRLLLRGVSAVAYGAALFAGVALAIAAVGMLFELDIEEDVYGHLAGWTFFALTPWIIVGGAEGLVAPAAPLPGGARRLVRLAAAFLVAPLVIGYTLILYAYAVQVAVTGEVPKNLLSPLVAGAAALWLLAAFLVEPLRGSDEAPALSRLVRWLPAALLPAIGLGLWAVGVRIGQHGWTEFRYIRVAAFVALGALAGWGTGRLLRRRSALPWTAVPVVLSLTALLSAVGPWGALAVTQRSQHARLVEAIDLAREAADRAASAGAAAESRRPVPAELFDRINDTGRFLIRHFGPEAIADVAPSAVGKGRSAWAYALADSLGFTRGLPAPRTDLAFELGAPLPDTAVLRGLMGGSLYPVRLVANGLRRMPTRMVVPGPCLAAMAWEAPDEPLNTAPVEDTLPGLRITLEPASSRILVRPADAGATWIADLGPVADAIRERFTENCDQSPSLSADEAVVELRDESGRPRGQLVLDRVQLLLLPPEIPADPAPQRAVIRMVTGSLLLPE